MPKDSEKEIKSIVARIEKLEQSVFGVEEEIIFTKKIQGSICNEFQNSKVSGLLRVHETTFEPAHQAASINQRLRLPKYRESDGKPFNLS